MATPRKDDGRRVAQVSPPRVPHGPPRADRSRLSILRAALFSAAERGVGRVAEITLRAPLDPVGGDESCDWVDSRLHTLALCGLTVLYLGCYARGVRLANRNWVNTPREAGEFALEQLAGKIGKHIDVFEATVTLPVWREKRAGLDGDVDGVAPRLDWKEIRPTARRGLKALFYALHERGVARTGGGRVNTPSQALMWMLEEIGRAGVTAE